MSNPLLLRWARLTALALTLSLTILQQGCATIFRGTHQPLQITSMPDSAQAQLSDGQVCTTPCSLSVERDWTGSVTYSKDGCEPQMISVFHNVSGTGIIVGGIIDYADGAVYDLQPNPVNAMLKCSRLASEAPSHAAV